MHVRSVRFTIEPQSARLRMMSSTGIVAGDARLEFFDMVVALWTATRSGLKVNGTGMRVVCRTSALVVGRRTVGMVFYIQM